MNTGTISQIKNIETYKVVDNKFDTLLDREFIPITEGSNDRFSDPLDAALQISYQHLSSAFSSFNCQIQEECEHALERMSIGKQGICEDCNKKIPDERMEVTCWRATRCVSCQNQYDRLHGR